jgi:hypothetical protein
MELEIIEPFPVPAWDDPALHDQARALAEWVREMLPAAGFTLAPFQRREGRALQMAKLVETLRTYHRMTRRTVPEPAIVYTGLVRLREYSMAPTSTALDRDRWLSAVVRAFYSLGEQQ